jgi:ATP-dependent Zn protease
MFHKTSHRSATKGAVLLALVVCAWLLPAAFADGAGVTPTYQTETYSEYQQQLAGGQVKSVAINKRVGSVRVTLTDGRHVRAKFKRKEEKDVAAALSAKGVPVTILTKAEAATEVLNLPKKPIHHKLRYIAAAVLIVVIVLVGVVLFITRKRKREREE